ncbi:MAG: LemA family protein [Candidatus Omnitrophota bacterium]|nr:LemA family protein [Candidatus Omnitrophota bacterium]
MTKNVKITLIAIAAIVLFFFMTFGGVYNKLVTAEEGVTSAWSQVENVYQRRADLVPNLVETVKGYAAHERETLQGVVDARSKISQMNVSADVIRDPNMLAQFQQAQGALSSALSRLMVVVERYPDLKASQNFLALQTQLEGTENRITVERKRFNDAAREFNTLRRVFPNVFIARMMGFGEKAYFTATEGAAQVPTVQF